MIRRKTLLVIVILGLTALFLSPWTSSPVPKTEPTSVPEESPAPPTAVPVSAEEELPADLEVTAVIDETGFELLQRQSAEFQNRHPDVSVRWTRLDPMSDTLGEELRENVRGADLLLVPNEWVRSLAVEGEIQPVDSAYVGDALTEQFTAIIAQMKWNGYIWGVPRDIDPYVTVWNRNVLESLKTETERMTPPLSFDQWQSLPQKLAEKAPNVSWLALDGRDPSALLAWFGSAAGIGQEDLFDRENEAWNGETLTAAIKLLDEQRAGIANMPIAPGGAGFWPAFASGNYAAAIVRVSQTAHMPDDLRANVEIDRSGWNHAFVWPNGTSFVLSSRSKQEDAAKRWVGEMTSAAHQLQNYERLGTLPVYRSLYASLDTGEASLAAASPGSFPNRAPGIADPALPDRMDRLGELSDGWLQGRLAGAEWRALWLDSLADPKAYD